MLFKIVIFIANKMHIIWQFLRFLRRSFLSSSVFENFRPKIWKFSRYCIWPKIVKFFHKFIKNVENFKIFCKIGPKNGKKLKFWLKFDRKTAEIRPKIGKNLKNNVLKFYKGGRSPGLSGRSPSNFREISRVPTLDLNQFIRSNIELIGNEHIGHPICSSRNRPSKSDIQFVWWTNRTSVLLNEQIGHPFCSSMSKSDVRFAHWANRISDEQIGWMSKSDTTDIYYI